MHWFYFFGGLGVGLGIATFVWTNLLSRAQPVETPSTLTSADLLSDPDVRALYAEVVRTGQPGRLIKMRGFQPLVIETWEAKVHPCPDCTVESGACAAHLAAIKPSCQGSCSWGNPHDGPCPPIDARGARQATPSETREDSKSSYPPFCGAV
jgi:hypothetical protein